MACSPVATALGSVTFSEWVRVGQIAVTLEKLKTFGPVEAADLFRDYCNLVLDSYREGHEKLVAVAGSVRSKQSFAELLFRTCLAVAEAGGETFLVDQVEIVTLYSLLEYDPAHFGLCRSQMIEEPDRGVIVIIKSDRVYSALYRAGSDA